MGERSFLRVGFVWKRVLQRLCCACLLVWIHSVQFGGWFKYYWPTFKMDNWRLNRITNLWSILRRRFYTFDLLYLVWFFPLFCRSLRTPPKVKSISENQSLGQFQDVLKRHLTRAWQMCMSPDSKMSFLGSGASATFSCLKFAKREIWNKSRYMLLLCKMSCFPNCWCCEKLFLKGIDAQKKRTSLRVAHLKPANGGYVVTVVYIVRNMWICRVLPLPKLPSFRLFGSGFAPKGESLIQIQSIMTRWKFERFVQFLPRSLGEDDPYWRS